MIDSPTVAPDAAIVLGIASTAMPFARTPEAEAERWLRILRLHGEAGAALQALGVSEGRLREPGHDAEEEHPVSGGLQERADPVERVIDEAVEIARRRGCAGVATTDLLLAVVCVYGDDFDRVLEAHGTDRDELVQRLGVPLSLSEICGEA
jgi:hypothetical protein